MLHLIYRLLVQPNTSRARTFSEAFVCSGGIETLLVLLQREAKAGDCIVAESTMGEESVSSDVPRLDIDVLEKNHDVGGSMGDGELFVSENNHQHQSRDSSASSFAVPTGVDIERTTSVSESSFHKNVGGITLSISAENARNNVYNADRSDGIIVAIIGLLGALVSSGHLGVGSHDPPDATSNLLGTGLLDGGGTMFDDKISLLLFSLQKVFQAAPNRLMTHNVYTALLGASVC